MFQLDARQLAELEKWCAEQDAKVSAIQGGGEAYYGACGGPLTYSFTPTSLGVCVRVKHAVTNETIDLSHTEDW